MKQDSTNATQPTNEPPEQTGPTDAPLLGANLSGSAGRLADLLFTLLVTLMLISPSWRAGVFTWLPILHLPMVGGAPVAAGALSVLPIILMASWAFCTISAWWSGKLPPWNWGRPGVSAPLLLLATAAVASLDTSLPFLAFTQVSALIIFWMAYLFLLNRRPNLVMPLSLVVLVQATIAIIQFLQQSDLNLAPFGELALDPAQPGISVFFARDQRWLRGYGLTAHPNQLGAVLAVVLLLLLPAFKRSQGRRRLLLAVVLAIGLLGLGATFSRASILAFIAGLLAWLFLEWRRAPQNWALPPLEKLLRSPAFLLAVVLAATVLFLYGDLALSRVVALDSNVEATSINQRSADYKLALRLIGAAPLRGAGQGRYVMAAGAVEPSAVIVHNVPLLVTAELGLGGTVLLLWLTLAGLRSRPAAVAVWLAVLVIGAVDVTLWLTGNWLASLLIAIVMANLSRDLMLFQPAVAEPG